MEYFHDATVLFSKVFCSFRYNLSHQTRLPILLHSNSNQAGQWVSVDFPYRQIVFLRKYRIRLRAVFIEMGVHGNFAKKIFFIGVVDYQSAQSIPKLSSA